MAGIRRKPGTGGILNVQGTTKMADERKDYVMFAETGHIGLKMQKPVEPPKEQPEDKEVDDGQLQQIQ